MKKVLSVLVLGVLLSGCMKEDIEGVNQHKNKVSNHAEQREEVKEKKDKEKEVAQEKPILVSDLEYSLIDTRTNTVVKKIRPVNYYNKEEFKKYAIQLADELARGIDIPMIPKQLKEDGTLTEGRSRVILEESELVEKLMNLTVDDTTIELPIYETKPNIELKDIKGIDSKVVSSFTTKFNPSVTGRVKNIELSAKAINNIVLGVGDRFYFNLIVGDTTPDKGYQKAKVIVNKKFVEDFGGGICQTSSTLYNAVDKLGLKILELHHHSLDVGYVPHGRDATVAYGSKDFKFQNTYGKPLIIKTFVDKNRGLLTVQLRTYK